MPGFLRSYPPAQEHIKYDPEYKKMIDEEYKKLMDKYINKSWNKRVLDFAYSVGIANMDSNYRDIKFFEHSIWATYGDGFGDWGQYLLGINGNYEKESAESDFITSGNITGRLFIGENFYKFYLEGVGTFKEGKLPLYACNLGGEIRLIQNIWLNLKGGFGYDTKAKKFNYNSNFSFKFGFSNLM